VARIALFHSEFGLRPSVEAAAARLRSLGHTVHVPDMFEGKLAETTEEAERLRAEVGTDELLRRAVSSVAPLTRGGAESDGLVYVGFSLGGAIAQNLALADTEARGLLLFHGTSDLRDDAATEIPVQLHMAEPDPFETEDWLGAWYLRMRKAGADPEVYRYRGAGHLFTDDAHPDWDAEAAAIAWAAAEAFLTELG
jgi:dienelactone hydrolase